MSDGGATAKLHTRFRAGIAQEPSGHWRLFLHVWHAHHGEGAPDEEYLWPAAYPSSAEASRAYAEVVRPVLVQIQEAARAAGGRVNVHAWGWLDEPREGG
jgi:hypothetical protein